MIGAQLQLLQACAAAAAGRPVSRGGMTERMVARAYAGGIAQLALLAAAYMQFAAIPAHDAGQLLAQGPGSLIPIEQHGHQADVVLMPEALAGGLGAEQGLG